MVSLVDAFETEKLALLQFATLPSTDVLSYIAERPSYTEDLVCQIAGQVLDALTTSTGVERSTSILSQQISLSALEDLLEELSKSNLPTLKPHKLLQAMEPRSREHTTLIMQLLKLLKKPRPSHNLMFGLLVFFFMSSCLANFLSREKLQRKQRTTSFKSDSSLNGSTRSALWRVQGSSCGSSRDSQSGAQLLRKLVPTGGLTLLTTC